MNNRGGACFHGPPPRPCGPRIARGPRGRGRGGYQAQQGYRQLVPYTPSRNPGRPRGRGNQRFIYSSRNSNPFPTPIDSSNNAHNQTGGESVELQGFFTQRSTTIAFEERKKDRLTSGSQIKCARTGCDMMLQTGPHCLYCGRCSANQQHEETKLLKEAIAKLQ